MASESRKFIIGSALLALAEDAAEMDHATLRKHLDELDPTGLEIETFGLILRRLAERNFAHAKALELAAKLTREITAPLAGNHGGAGR